MTVIVSNESDPVSSMSKITEIVPNSEHIGFSLVWRLSQDLFLILAQPRRSCTGHAHRRGG